MILFNNLLFEEYYYSVYSKVVYFAINEFNYDCNTEEIIFSF